MTYPLNCIFLVLLICYSVLPSISWENLDKTWNSMNTEYRLECTMRKILRALFHMNSMDSIFNKLQSFILFIWQFPKLIYFSLYLMIVAHFIILWIVKEWFLSIRMQTWSLVPQSAWAEIVAAHVCNAKI